MLLKNKIPIGFKYYLIIILLDPQPLAEDDGIVFTPVIAKFNK